MPEVQDHCALLNDGNRLPLVGFGSSRITGNTAAVIEAALDCGYRHIDTAHVYLNEEDVGRGVHNWLRKTGAKRSEVFVVTKLPITAMHPEKVEESLRKSLQLLNLSYVDLYLVHGPVGMKEDEAGGVNPAKDQDGFHQCDFSTDIIANWKAMEAMVAAGLTRSIGVSNYNIRQLRKTLAVARIPPAVVQVELNAYFQQHELHKYCEANNVVLTAYAPLGSPEFTGWPVSKTVSRDRLLSNPVVTLVASNHDVSEAEVLLRFWVQQGVAVIPKSENPGRMATNRQVTDWDLTDLEMSALKSLDRGEAGRWFDMYSYSEGVWKYLSLHPERPF